MTEIISGLLILIMLVLCPFFAGLLFAAKKDDLRTIWILGLLTQWATVFCVAVPLIVLRKTLSLTVNVSVALFLIVSFLGVLSFAFRLKRGNAPEISFKIDALSKPEIIYLAVFLGLVLFQIYKTVFYAYEDGDDAYYVSVAQNAVSADSMYTIDAYLGIPVTLNYRYALAPFPIWISILSRLSGINVAIMCHTILAPILIVLTYVIYSEIASEFFEDKEKRYVFLSVLSLIIMFENVSTSTQGTFLLTRARQGKEALANVILPFLFLCILRIVKSGQEITFTDFLKLIITGVAAALTSLFGNILVGIVLFFLFILCIVKKSSKKTLFYIALSVLPNILVALVYVIL